MAWHRSARLAMITAGFGVFVAADDLMVVATMLRPMIDDFQLVVPDDLGAAAWIVNSYLVAYVAVMPVAGRLSDLFGRRSVFIAAMSVFALGSLVIPAADSLAVLYTGRVMTALGGGALVPVAMAVAADLHRGPDRVRALGTLAAIETIGWVWGPLYGAILVRYLTWQWQFHLNVGLAAVGIVAAWLTLDTTSDRADEGQKPGRNLRSLLRLGLGPALLTVGLVALSLALLSGAQIQSVTGLDELTGSNDSALVGPWLYGVAGLAFAAFAWSERRSGQPMISRQLLSDHPAVSALVVNVAVSVGLVIALINVPLFVNIVDGGGDTGVARAAVRSGWLLTAFTLVMAVTSYVGGVWSGSSSANRSGDVGLRWRRPTAVGLAVGALGLASMGAVWTVSTSPWLMAVQLAVTGAGIGLVLAPTSAAVVDAADDNQRGLASGLVIVARLVGFSVGLAALTTWGLRRYDQFRAAVELPPITDPDYATEVASATQEVSTAALAETFVGAALALAIGLLALGLVTRVARPAVAGPFLNRTTPGE